MVPWNGSQFFVQRHDLISLDYATVFVSNLYKLEVLKDQQLVFQWREEKWFNTATEPTRYYYRLHPSRVGDP